MLVGLLLSPCWCHPWVRKDAPQVAWWGPEMSFPWAWSPGWPVLMELPLGLLAYLERKTLSWATFSCWGESGGYQAYATFHHQVRSQERGWCAFPQVLGFPISPPSYFCLSECFSGCLLHYFRMFLVVLSKEEEGQMNLYHFLPNLKPQKNVLIISLSLVETSHFSSHFLAFC